MSDFHFQKIQLLECVPPAAVFAGIFQSASWQPNPLQSKLQILQQLTVVLIMTMMMMMVLLYRGVLASKVNKVQIEFGDKFPLDKFSAMYMHQMIFSFFLFEF